jgi:hypothetical protein
MFFISPLFFGFLAAAGALFAELFVFSFFVENPAVYSVAATNTNFVFAAGGILFVFLSALLEECLKYTILKQTLASPNSPRQLIVFLVLFNIGFSGLEITFLILNNPPHTLPTLFHIISVFLLHLTTIFLLGYSLSRQSLKKFVWIALLLATLVHFLYNVAIFYQNSLHI